jgi:hypothetical protein
MISCHDAHMCLRRAAQHMLRVACPSGFMSPDSEHCCCTAANPRSFFQSHNASPAVEREVYRYYYYVYTRCKQVRRPIWHSLLNSPLVPVTFPTAYQPGGAPLLLLSLHVLQTSEAPAMSQCLAAAAATCGASHSSKSLATTCECAACFHAQCPPWACLKAYA